MISILPTKEHIRDFESKSVVQTADITIKDLQNIGKSKHRYLNVIGENDKMLIEISKSPK